jgi:hypothetical protein
MPECDRLLGLYFRAWNKLEHGLVELFTMLLGAHATAARIIVASGIGQQTLREITLALAGQWLKHSDAEILRKLLDRVKRAATKRNRLAHGTWQLDIKINKPGPNTATWIRFYEPSNPRLYSQMHGRRPSQKIRDDYIFTVARINRIAEETYDLSREIETFSKGVSIVPFPEPQPIEIAAPHAWKSLSAPLT